MENKLTIGDLNLFEEFVQPVGEYCFPPDYRTPKKGWQIVEDNGLMSHHLRIAETLLSYNQNNNFYKWPVPLDVDLENLRQYTIDNHTLFLKLIATYKQEYKMV